MQSVTVINKATMEKSDVNSNIIKLEKGSIIQVKLHRDDVAEITQDGNNLIIKLKNGETLTIENYFVVDAEGNNNDVVFEGTECAFLVLDWQNGLIGFKELAGLEELLPIVVGGGSAAASNLLPWIIGGGLVGGIAGATGGSNDSSKEPKNNAPVAGKDDKETPENIAVTGTVPVTDVDDDKLSYIIKESPKNGTVTIDPATGEYTYTPNPDFNGEDSFTVTVDDGKGGTVDVPVNVTVTPETDLPIDEAPEAPVVTINPIVPDKDGSTTITGTVDKPDADVIVTIDGKCYD